MEQTKETFTLRLPKGALEGLEEIVELESLFVEKEREITLRGVAARLIVKGIDEWRSDRRQKLYERAEKLKSKLEKHRAIA